MPSAFPSTRPSIKLCFKPASNLVVLLGTISRVILTFTTPYGCPLVLSICRALKDSLTDNEGKGHIKVVVDAKSDRVLGIHLVGPEVAEILQVC